MYDSRDVRATLASAGAGGLPAPELLSSESVGLFYEETPQFDDDHGKTWLIRGQNFVIAYTEVAPGGTVSRIDHPDEYMAMVPDRETPAVLSAGTETNEIDGYSMIVMPPGDSIITLTKGGRLVRVFSTNSEELNAQCANADAYAEPRINVTPLTPWPDPKGGFKIRTYSLDVPQQEGRFGRIWRCTTVMINVFDPQMGPRDTTRLSPHSHDDFEQASLVLGGTFAHHLRWPWTVDLASWREDVHLDVKAPSVAVIPPPTIHTSRGTAAGANDLVDIFSPPRLDFSMKENWVLNAEDYLLPNT
ncbi:hypothetical protein [uncultured Roseobacter sp.]|uniref:hypothetical protein n=1 Tax=uncultured Roseobacter sp. TaxID=114847 RepID=UPI00261DCEF2|nr:hypothetical protein [uncultured Roseobacter sp.]